MPLPLRSEEVAVRLRDYSMDNYLTIGATMKSVALSVGAYVLVQILADLPTQWFRLLPWLASFGALIVSYVTWGRGVLLVNARANLFDNVLPFLMGIAEFSLFAVLYGSKGDDLLWLNWPLCLSAHAFLGALIIDHRLRVTSITRDYETRLVDLGHKLHAWLRRDRLGAAGIGILSLVFWAMGRWWIFPSYGSVYYGVVQFVVAGIFFGVLMLIAAVADSQRKQIDSYVSKLIRSDENSADLRRIPVDSELPAPVGRAS